MWIFTAATQHPCGTEGLTQVLGSSTPPSFWLRHYTFYQLSGLIGLCSPNAKGLHTFLDKKKKAKLETLTYLGPHSYSRINQVSCPVYLKAGQASPREQQQVNQSFFFFFRAPASQLSTAPSLPVGRKTPELDCLGGIFPTHGVDT